MSTLLEKVESVVGKAPPHPVLGYPDAVALAREFLASVGGKITAHPLDVFPTTVEELAALIVERGPEEVARIYEQREWRIHKGSQEWHEQLNKEGDPFRYVYEPPLWFQADELLKGVDGGVYAAGGIRATKTNWAIHRGMLAAYHLPGIKLWFMVGTKASSVSLQQKWVWHYTPREWRQWNHKRRAHPTARINYDAASGFVLGNNDARVIWPNGSEFQFLTYEQDPKGFMGFKLGIMVTAKLEKFLAAHPMLHNIGAVLDEDAPVDWLREAERRCVDNAAKILWTYSTEEGVTPAIRALVKGARTLTQRKAQHLEAEQRHHPDCGPGKMPFTQLSADGRWGIIYFHTELNPFGETAKRTAAMYASKPAPVRRRHLYGYSEDVASRLFPGFTDFHIIDPAHLPDTSRFAVRTNYMVTDPAQARPWATLWFGVLPDGTHIITRDWPDERRHGAWAIPAADIKQPDGIVGPAQKKTDGGWIYLKQAWREMETIRVPQELVDFQRSRKTTFRLDEQGELLERVRQAVPDPHHRALIALACRRGRDLGRPMHESVLIRYIDPRAAATERETDDGGTNAIDELAKDHEGAPGMIFEPAYSGKRIGSASDPGSGAGAVDTLLRGTWDRERYPRPVPHVAEPKLYVFKHCTQVIQCLFTYTGAGGAKGGWKDFADLVRYAALTRREFVDGGEDVIRGGG